MSSGNPTKSQQACASKESLSEAVYPLDLPVSPKMGRANHPPSRQAGNSLKANASARFCLILIFEGTYLGLSFAHKLARG
jgi:hypothetical protein